MIHLNLTNANILIIDDKQPNIDVLTGFLDDEGYANYTSTTDSRKAIELFKESKPDLIMLDLHMPHLNGFQILEQLKALIPEDDYLPILVLTADTTPEIKLEALVAGAKDFISKPFDLMEVELRIKNLLATRSMHLQLKSQNLILEEKVEERNIELKMTIVELMAAKENAEESDKLKTAFINNISHEIRTPLNGILGFGQLLVGSELSEEERMEFFEHIEKSSNRLINTITDYMDMAMLVSNTMKVNKKEFALEAVFETTTVKAKKLCTDNNIEFKLKIPDVTTGLTVNSDPELLQKILDKLLKNALKFTKEGSITCGYKTNTEHLEFFVKDTGSGIDNDMQDLIFEMFRQGDSSMTREYEGSGLGLAIARGLVTLLGGEMHVSSEKGKGSEFIFTIPIKNSAMTTSPAAIITSKPQNTKNPLILIAEDDEINNDFLAMVLLSSGYNHIHAANGKEAVDFCRQNPEISIVLMDIKMPVMHGDEATKQIRVFRPELPIIATTAHAQTGDEHRFLEAGCNDYLPKPINKDKLLATIKKYVE